MKRLCEKKFLALCLVPFLGICCARAEEPEPQMLKNSPLSLQKPESSQSEPQQTPLSEDVSSEKGTESVDSDSQTETVIYDELDFDSSLYVAGFFENVFNVQHDSPNQMYRVVKLKRTVYIDPALDFNSYTFEGYDSVEQGPEFGVITEDHRRLTYTMSDLTRLHRKNGISPLSDSFVLVRNETDEHLVTTRTEVDVTVYFSFDPLSIKQWYIKNYGLDTYEVSTRNYELGLYPRRGYGLDGVPSLDLNVIPVWKSGITGKGVNVAVFDTGVDPNNPDLKNKLDMKKAQDLSGYLYPIDFTSGNSHGTRVAGIIGAEAGNLLGVRGIAYDARLIPVIPDYRDIYALNYSFPYFMQLSRDLVISSSIGAEPGSIDNFMNENAGTIIPPGTVRRRRVPVS